MPLSQRATKQELEAYREQGYFVRNARFSEMDLEALRTAVEAIHAAIEHEAEASATPVERIDDRRYQRLLGSTIKWEWAEGSRAIRSMEPVHHLDACIDGLVDDPRLWEPALDLIGCEAVSLFTDKLNFKRPSGAPFPWHQDSPYWAFGCEHLDRLASVQLYLDDAQRENGCLWVIPESHRLGVLPGLQDRGVLGKLYTNLEGVETHPPHAIEAPGGSLIFFHGDLIHGSQTNRSSASRRALIFTFQPQGFPLWHGGRVRVTPGSARLATLSRSLGARPPSRR